jgi:hypothetical protein
LFDEDCRKAAAAILDDVRKGWVSDPPGVALYNQLRTDQAGLPIYHDIRGTSSLEGSVHGPVRSRFGSLGASVEMSVALLSDFCYRKNTEVSRAFIFSHIILKYLSYSPVPFTEMASFTTDIMILGSKTTSISYINLSHLINRARPALAI